MPNKEFTTDEVEAVEPDEVIEPPREGTLAWLQLQEHVHVEGLGEVPVLHRLDLTDGSIYLGEDDGRCRYVRPDGERCAGARTKRYGLCLPHAGGGGQDHAAMSRAGHAAKTRLRIARTQLGIGARRSADPRQIARVAAHARAQEIAEAMLAPLDDDDLSALARQRSAVTILDSLFPVQQVTVTVDVPADEAGVQALGWQEMQQLAAQLLGDTGVTGELEAA